MRRPIMTSPLLWIAATLLALQSTNLANADMTHHNHNRITSSSAASLHKTWGQLIQHESLTASHTEKMSSNDGSNTNNVVNRRSNLLLSQVPCFVRRLQLQHHQSLHQKPAIDIKQWSAVTEYVITKTRGGAATDHDDDEYDTTDDESSDEEEYDSEYDEEYSDYDDESDNDEKEEESDNLVSTLTSSSLQSSLRSKSSSKQQQIIQQYDEVLTPPAMQQLVISLGVMFLSQRIDILDTKTVRIARFAFVAYLVTMQVFLLYVRLRAKAVNDRTEIVLSNPLASLVQGAAGAAGGGGGGNFMVKALADQMLSSTTTIYEYDLAQAKKMNSGLLMPMVFLYFLHFKMKQVQPLLMQTATGVMNMIYSPLFQVYVLGRNLERPFQSPGNPMMGGATSQEEESGGDDKGVEDDVDDGEGEESVDSEEEEGKAEEEESDESEYDSDEE